MSVATTLELSPKVKVMNSATLNVKGRLLSIDFYLSPLLIVMTSVRERDDLKLLTILVSIELKIRIVILSKYIDRQII